MEWAKVTLLFGVSVLSILTGAAVLLSDRKRLSNSLFFLLMLSMAGWSIGVGVFLLTSSSEIAQWCAKIFYAFPLFIGWSLFMFALTFPDRKKPNVPLNIVVTSSLAILLILLFFKQGFLIETILNHDWGKEVVLNHVHYLFYSAFLLLCFVGTLGIMFYKMRNDHGLHAAQASLFFYGFLVTFFVGIFFNLILPWWGNYHLIWVGPNCVIIFTSAIAYNIVKHKMFDVRRFVARALAYILLVSAMTAVYAGMVFGLANNLAPEDSLLAKQVVPITTAILLAFSVPYLKLIFDKLTNRIFFRDAYNTQEFLDHLNKTLVSNIELRILLRRTAQVIQENIKCEVCLIGVRGTESTPFRVVGAEFNTDNTDELAYMCEEEIPRIPERVIKTDDLSPHYAKLRKVLHGHNISLICVPSGGQPGETALVHLMLGPKKSGNSYNLQDIQVIEIITDELVIAIQNALRFEEIQSFNTTLQARINEATNKLQRSNNKLQVLDQTKDEFISMASHQLRTPLTSIKGYLSMVLEGDAGDINDEQRKMLQQAFISSQRMTYLISDLLNVSRLKTGKFVIERSPTDLAQVVEQEVSQLRESAGLRNLQLIYDKPADFPTLDLDETKIRQVIMNFLDNAIYYTHDGGDIKIELANKSQSVELTVTDSGIGVPKRLQPHLFTKFYRAPNAKRARPDGTGLGLFMAKKIIVAQGGALIFRSMEGKGSTFGFSFPKNSTSEAS